MKVTVPVAVALAASVEAAHLNARQRRGDQGNPDRGSRKGNPNRGDPDRGGNNRGGIPDGYTSEALLFCSSFLKSKTATHTVTHGGTTTVTSTYKVTTTVTPTKKPTPTPSPSPTSDTGSGCGIVGNVKTTSAYYLESSGTKNTFSACQALCKADSKCVSFSYGEAYCMLFDIKAEDNTEFDPMSPYTFYDVTCPKEISVKRQLGIEIPGIVDVSIPLGLNIPRDISSACSCFITRGPAETTVTRTITSNVTKTATTTSTITRTARGDDDLVGDSA